jgi:hypothetical protein
LQSVAGFWIVAISATVIFGLLIFSPRIPSALGWLGWAGAVVCAVTAGVLRQRLHFLESVLEVSRFGLAEVHPDGVRRTILWTAPLVLRYRRWPKRFELGISGRRDTIRLDFDRAGVDRAFRLTVEYGGFPDILSKGDAA